MSEANPAIDYDLFGHCVICHKNMIIEQAIDGIVQKRYTPDYTERQFVLNDGSKMRVAMCLKDAEAQIDAKQIMDCVINGWERETAEMVKSDLFPHWTPEKKEVYMNEYRKKEITGFIGEIEKDKSDKEIK